MFKNDRADFEAKWDDIEVFMQYGMLSDDKFYDRAEKFSLLKNTKGEYFTFEEYKGKIKDTQTDKDGKLTILYTHDAEEQHALVAAAEERGYDVLVQDGPLASHFIQKAEMKLEASFSRIDSDTLDNLIKKDDEMPSKLSKEEEEALKPVYARKCF